MEIWPRRAETHPILAGVMMDEAILLPSQTGRQEKNRSSKTRREAATKTAEISAIMIQTTRACLPQPHGLVALRRPC